MSEFSRNLGLLAFLATLLWFPGGVLVGDDDVVLEEMFSSGGGTTGIAFYEGHLFALSKSGVVRKIDPRNGVVLETVTLPANSHHVHYHGLTVRDTTFFVYEMTSGEIREVSSLDYRVTASIPAPEGNPVYALEHEDSRLWVGHHSNGDSTPVEVIDPDTGHVLATHDYGLFDVHGLRFVAGDVWALDNQTDRLLRIAPDGSTVETLPLPSASWRALAFDGTDLWCADASTVFKVGVVATPGVWVRGDVNGDGWIDISDPISLLDHLFRSGQNLPCDDSADVDDDGAHGLEDVQYLLQTLFGFGPPPPLPFPECGADPTADALDCDVARCP